MLSFSYRYEMSNCLFEAAFEQILKDCKCAPGFHNEGGADAMEVRVTRDPETPSHLCH